MTPPAHAGVALRAPRRSACRRAQIRRRRATALTCLAVVTAILVVYATSAGNSSHAYPQPRPPASASTHNPQATSLRVHA
jgi:hypothetical protein